MHPSTPAIGNLARANTKELTSFAASFPKDATKAQQLCQLINKTTMKVVCEGVTTCFKQHHCIHQRKAQVVSFSTIVTGEDAPMCLAHLGDTTTVARPVKIPATESRGHTTAPIRRKDTEDCNMPVSTSQPTHLDPLDDNGTIVPGLAT